MTDQDAKNKHSDDVANALDERLRRALQRLTGDQVSIESAEQLKDHLITLLGNTECEAAECDLDAVTTLVEELDAENDEHDGIQFSVKYRGRILTHFNVEQEGS